MKEIVMEWHRMGWLALAAVGTTVVLSRAQVAAARQDNGFREFLHQFEQSTTRFINGDPGPWKAGASRQDDVTLMGGWGIVTRGWPATGSRYDWAAQRFADSGAQLTVEYISSFVSGDLAYTVAIERSTVRLADQTAPAPMNLRVTHVFRREDGQWKLVHRHADPLLETTIPRSVLQP
jgi:ketosteroid isomerase-like protein